MKEVDIRIHLPFINQRLKRFEKKENQCHSSKFDLEIIFHLKYVIYVTLIVLLMLFLNE